MCTHILGVLAKLKSKVEAVDEHMEQVCYIGNMTESFLLFFAPPYDILPPPPFTILLFLHGSLPLFFFFFFACVPLYPSPSLFLSLSASPSVPVCRYIPSPLAVFVADNRVRAGQMSKTEG